MCKKVSIIGVGNILLKDEGLGVRVVEEIKALYKFDKRVRLVDGGTGGFSLIYHIKDSDFLILIDAVDACTEPTSIFKYDLEASNVTVPQGFSPVYLSSHHIGVMDVINISRVLYGKPEVVKVIGVQPLDTSLGLEVTPGIRSVIPTVVSLVLKELNSLGIYPFR